MLIGFSVPIAIELCYKKNRHKVFKKNDTSAIEVHIALEKRKNDLVAVLVYTCVSNKGKLWPLIYDFYIYTYMWISILDLHSTTRRVGVREFSTYLLLLY